MLFFDIVGDKIESVYSWAAQYAPQWLIKIVTILLMVDILVWAFSL